jgi:two-component system cell cycle sensor histidine kinase/response regulator CckA
VKTVLVVDDEALIRMIVKKVLGKAGYTLLEAENGASAIALAGSHPETIDLLLSDLQLPDIRGTEIYDRLRKSHPTMRVLFMSGFGERDPARADSELGENFLQKPFSLVDLEAAVGRALA